MRLVSPVRPSLHRRTKGTPGSRQRRARGFSRMEVMGLLALTITILLRVVAAEDSGSQICLPAPLWKTDGEAASLGSLRDKLFNQQLENISYFIVNEKDPLSRHLYPELKRRAPDGVPVYQQKPEEPDIWEILGGEKDDFLIYDRCGRLTFHIRLPYSYLHFPYVEAAIRSTYLKDHCGNCTFYEHNATLELTRNGTSYPENATEWMKVDQQSTTVPPTEEYQSPHGQNAVRHDHQLRITSDEKHQNHQPLSIEQKQEPINQHDEDQLNSPHPIDNNEEQKSHHHHHLQLNKEQELEPPSNNRRDQPHKAHTHQHHGDEHRNHN
ncbi:hypothetical protein NDU88_001389 [Pleurodeles waltl]|uniref:Selenoprotein P N-terminal domain-containing protein n=1 Tax=Pleurodeles waltl TaxID=8319 RepID=A0AAV7SZZ9_PLEWA|nr:hypothetical protein NDU88_001389 [Pleurodeles waltl]